MKLHYHGENLEHSLFLGGRHAFCCTNSKYETTVNRLYKYQGLPRDSEYFGLPWRDTRIVFFTRWPHLPHMLVSKLQRPELPYTPPVL